MSSIAPTVFDHTLFLVLAVLLPLFGWLGVRRLRRNLDAGLPYTRRIIDYRNNMRLFGILPDSQSLNAYADRCLARPAYQAALAREDA